MTFGATVDTSRPHTVIEAHHPVDLWVPRHAHLAKGTYQFPGDLRPYFRDVATRRLVAAGVVSVRYVAVDEVPQTVSARTEMVPASSVVSPKSLDLVAQMPADFAPTSMSSEPAHVVLAAPTVGTSAPEQAEVVATPEQAIYVTPVMTLEPTIAAIHTETPAVDISEPEMSITETPAVVTEPVAVPTETPAVVTEAPVVATETEPVTTEVVPVATEIEHVTAEALATAQPVRRRQRNQL